ncbi:hypothetical protein Enr8_04040 [Blastopirellula retiformator]|uniref:HNH domain-containing protein n=2 Tax=Blastopirellula retiformator TaxID=2527970 RepID=A0A5C5VLA9_9BACT|nr:hypothetical protein Enr8_04040 [Blastopirellula retiformator]
MPQSAHVLTFPVDHIIARQHGGETVLENLALSCVRYNSDKGPNSAGIAPQSQILTRLFHPRDDRWDDHFTLDGALIHGITSIGRTTVELLQMNHQDYVTLRASLIFGRQVPTNFGVALTRLSLAPSSKRDKPSNRLPTSSRTYLTFAHSS